MDPAEKARATKMAKKYGARTSTALIFTRLNGDVFYVISGKLQGIFRAKSKHRYLPIAEAEVKAIIRSDDGWKKKKLISNAFIGLATDHIEACSLI